MPFPGDDKDDRDAHDERHAGSAGPHVDLFDQLFSTVFGGAGRDGSAGLDGRVDERGGIHLASQNTPRTGSLKAELLTSGNGNDQSHSSMNSNTIDPTEDPLIDQLEAAVEAMFTGSRGWIEAVQLPVAVTSVPPLDWQDDSTTKDNAHMRRRTTSTSSSSSFRRNADGSTERITTTRHADGRVESETTRCTAQGVCETVRELFDQSGRMQGSGRVPVQEPSARPWWKPW